MQQDHFSTIVDNMAFSGVGRSRFRAFEQVRVITDFPQMHQDIVQSGGVHAVHRIHNCHVFQQDIFVPAKRKKLVKKKFF
jgi:hypothetical protein